MDSRLTHCVILDLCLCKVFRQVCVCMHVSVANVYVYWMHPCMYASGCIQTGVCVCACVCLLMNVYTHVHTHTCVGVYACISLYR